MVSGVPRYFFDTDNGDYLHRDEDGVELADDEAARVMAQAALPDMANDALPNGERRAFSVKVRNPPDTVLYTVCLTLVGEWHDGRRN